MTSSAASGPAPPGAEFVWRGRAVQPREAATFYLVGSGALLALGIGLNYLLTGGQWYLGPADPNLRSYVRSDPYDLLSAGILGASLLCLGAGFLAAYTPTLRSRWFQLLTTLALVFLTLAGLGYAGRAGVGDPTVALVSGIVFGFVALAWAIATLIGPGPRMHYARAVGFVTFGLYWATQAMKLYHAEEGDFVNAAFAGLAVFFFNYFAYHELLSSQRNEDPRALNWLAGTAFLTTGVYFATHKLEPVSHWLILQVSKQTTWLLQFFNQGVIRAGGTPDGSQIFYPAPPSEGGMWFPVQIILACTAIQSIMIFVGGILSLRPPRRGEGWTGKAHVFETLRPSYQTRRFFALLLTVPLIYVLNLFRNVIIIWMSGQARPVGFAEGSTWTGFVCGLSAESNCTASDAAFWFSHNIIGKGGSLVALIIIAFMVFQILPELYDSIIGLLDLRERRGPLERWFRPGAGGAGGGRVLESQPSRPVSPEAPIPVPDRLHER